jgi:hypothetical protein
MGLHIGKPHPDTASVSRAWFRPACLRGLWKRGWTDAEIASHTLMSTYTTARIRSRLRLAPHRPVEGAA